MQTAPSSTNIVEVNGLQKTFRLYARRWDRLSEWLTLGRTVRHENFRALHDVSFGVRRGESLGIIGVNGSGKSTLLKIISGAMYPSAGTVEIRGRVLSLLELGTGLNTELTGRQNVVNSARLLGFPSEYATERMDRIEEFAELGEFFNRPVRLYSSGMLVRLSFSMFACFDPEIFVVDEALSVGDVFFQQKCARRIQEMRAGGTTMLFVSHDLAAVEALCDRVLLLGKGRILHDGDTKTGIRLYYAVGGSGIAAPAISAAGHVHPPALGEASLPQESSGSFGPIDPENLPWQTPDSRDSFGDGSAEIDAICFRHGGGRHDSVATEGEWVEILIRGKIAREIAACNAGFGIYDRHNRLLFARSWLNAGLAPAALTAGQGLVARFCVRLDLEPGEYLLSVALTEALKDDLSPSGWNQHVGGMRYVELPHAAVIAVTPRADRARNHFGPANLQTHLDRLNLPIL